MGGMKPLPYPLWIYHSRPNTNFVPVSGSSFFETVPMQGIIPEMNSSNQAFSL
jgi:hypothetical protein